MRLLILSVAVLALAACDNAKKADPNARAAGNEVLDGTISDSMLNLDRSTAEAPLAPAKAGKDDDKAGQKKGADASDAADDAGDEPAAKPTPSAKASPADADQ